MCVTSKFNGQGEGISETQVSIGRKRGAWECLKVWDTRTKEGDRSEGLHSSVVI